MKSVLRSKTATIVAVLVLLGVVIYANSLQNGMFWDDDDGILNNSYVQNFQVGKFFSENLIAGSGIFSNYWRPMLLLTYGTEWALWGSWSPGFHATNVAIHILNAILVFFVFFRLLKKRSVSFFASLVFLMHPLQTEAVTYVSGRGDPLSFLFMLLGILWYLKFKDSKQKKFYMLVIGAFIFALLTKERSAIFPAFLVAIEAWEIIRKKEWFSSERVKKALIELLPFFCISALYLLLRGSVLNFGDTFNIYAAETYYTTHLSARIFTFLHILPSYLSLFFLPVTLFMERSETISVLAFPSISVFIGVLTLLLPLLISLLRLKEKPGYLLGTLWFYTSVFAISGIAVPLAGLMFEHYMYVPIVGIGIFLGTALCDLRDSGILKNWGRNLGVAVLICWIGFLGIRTVLRNSEWDNPIRFYTQTLEHAPTSMRTWNNLGMAYADRENYDEARHSYSKAIRLNPRNPIPYYNLGNVYEDMGEESKAIELWNKSLELDPEFFPAKRKLGGF